MNKLRLDEHQRIERYILCKMDDDEASEFEAEFLSDQACLEQLEIAKKLYHGLGMIADSAPAEVASNSVTEVAAPKSASNDSSWWNAKIPVWSMAAMLVIALMPSVSMFQENSSSALPGGGISVISMPMTGARSIEQSELVITANDERTVLSFYIDSDIDSLVFPEYRFQIRRLEAAGESPITSVVRLDSNDMLYVDLGDSYLTQGKYEYTVSGIGEAQTAKSLVSGVLKVK